MLNRWSVNILLKSVIVVMSAVAVLTFATGAWRIYHRYETASRIAVLTKASTAVFRALNDLDIDSSFTGRALKAANPASPRDIKRIAGFRASGMPQLKSAIDILDHADFPQTRASVDRLKQEMATILPLQAETLSALGKPKAERPDGLAKEYVATGTQIFDTLSELGKQLTAAVKLNDPVIDSMMMAKDLAWTMRNSAADIASTIGVALTFKKVPPNAQTIFTKKTAQVDTAWSLIQALDYGQALPAAYTTAVAKAKALYFAPALVAMRNHVIQQFISGQKPDITVGAWMGRSLPAVNALLDVALTSLDSARARANDIRAAAMDDLATQLGLLGSALVLGIGSFVAIGSRVIRPLLAIRDRMLKVAGGDLSVEVGFADRHDEIGALAGALATFKENAAAKARIEEEQRSRHAEAAQRQQTTEDAIRRFEGEIGTALQALGDASGQMRDASDQIAGAADQSDQRVQAIVGAASEASKNVQTVATSTEQLSASSTEISGQVTRAAQIANRAVDEAKQTDGTIQSLVGATSRIGEIIELITSIAGQTNLLALNATIEAARAGEAGKGFAVVASEVKSLANQTAKATEDISTQIAAVQNVTKDAVDAIQRIGGTIAEVSSVATSIAAAVEEQTAATQEIKRSTQEAARRTEEVSANMTGVADATDRTGDAATGVKAAVSTLSSQAERLKLNIHDFLNKIRAA